MMKIIIIAILQTIYILYRASKSGQYEKFIRRHQLHCATEIALLEAKIILEENYSKELKKYNATSS